MALIFFFGSCREFAQYVCCKGPQTNRIEKGKLDPVVTTVRNKKMQLCPLSVKGGNGWYLVVLSQYEAVPMHCTVVIDVTGSVEGIYAFIYWKKWKSIQVLTMPY